jgi:hypothetical protein
VFDVANSLDNLLVLYHNKNTIEPSFTIEGNADKKENCDNLDTCASSREWISDIPSLVAFLKLREVRQTMTDYKKSLGGGGRNIWQGRQKGWKRRAVLSRS